MQVERFVLGMFATNCYLLTGGRQDSCLLIDPADNGRQLVRLLEQRQLRPEAVLLTHSHYDHILAVPDLQARWPELPVYCHPLDVPAQKTERDMGMEFPTVAAFSHLRPLREGQVLDLAGLTVTVLHTPGHTPGSVTFAIEDTLFTGDTLFCGSIGRTDFPGGDDAQMAASLRRLAALPGDPRVLAGHESETTLDRERRHNPYLLSLSGGGTGSQSSPKGTT